MKTQKKKLKEEQMLDAAEKLFSTIGLNNTTMDDIAKEAGYTKVTLYAYFKSKENLYMAITHRALQSLLDTCYKVVEQSNGKTGFETSRDLFVAYLSFSEEHFFYYQMLLEYLSFIRSSSEKRAGRNMSEAMKNSIYRKKVRDIHNLPLTLIVNEIKKGQKDGSIRNMRKPEEIYLTNWALLIGYTKLNAASSEDERKTMFQIQLVEWRLYIIYLIEKVLQDEE